MPAAAGTTGGENGMQERACARFAHRIACKQAPTARHLYFRVSQTLGEAAAALGGMREVAAT